MSHLTPTADDLLYEMVNNIPAQSWMSRGNISLTTGGDNEQREKNWVRLSLEDFDITPQAYDNVMSAILRVNKVALDHGKKPRTINHHCHILSRFYVDVDVPKSLPKIERENWANLIVRACAGVMRDHFSPDYNNPIAMHATRNDFACYHLYFDTIVINRSSVSRFFSLVHERLRRQNLHTDAIKKILDVGASTRQALRLPFCDKKHELGSDYREADNRWTAEEAVHKPSIHLPVDADAHKPLTMFTVSPDEALLRKFVADPLSHG